MMIFSFALFLLLNVVVLTHAQVASPGSPVMDPGSTPLPNAPTPTRYVPPTPPPAPDASCVFGPGGLYCQPTPSPPNIAICSSKNETDACDVDSSKDEICMHYRRIDDPSPAFPMKCFDKTSLPAEGACESSEATASTKCRVAGMVSNCNRDEQAHMFCLRNLALSSAQCDEKKRSFKCGFNLSCRQTKNVACYYQGVRGNCVASDAAKPGETHACMLESTCNKDSHGAFCYVDNEKVGICVVDPLTQKSTCDTVGVPLDTTFDDTVGSCGGAIGDSSTDLLAGSFPKVTGVDNGGGNGFDAGGPGVVYEYYITSDLPVLISTAKNSVSWALRSSCAADTEVGQRLLKIEKTVDGDKMTLHSGIGGKPTSAACTLPPETTSDTSTSTTRTGTSSSDNTPSPSGDTTTTEKDVVHEEDPPLTPQVTEQSAATSLAIGGGLLSSLLLPRRQAFATLVVVALAFLFSNSMTKAASFQRYPCNAFIEVYAGASVGIGGIGKTIKIHYTNSLTGEKKSFGRYYPPQRPFGRPFVINGATVVPAVRSSNDWIIDDVQESSIDADKAKRWTVAAQGEHASVASFNALSLHLLAHAAPPSLLLASQRAATDEIIHAQLSFSLASQFDSSIQNIGPDALPRSTITSLNAPSLKELAMAAFEEGCVHETKSVLEAADHFDEPDATESERNVLLTIVQDETRHAVFAWQLVRWCVEQDESIRNELLQIWNKERESLSQRDADAIGFVVERLLLDEEFATVAYDRLVAPRVELSSTDQLLADVVVDSLHNIGEN